MTFSRERVHSELAVAGEAGQFLTNTESSETDDRVDQFRNYWGTCIAPIPLPDSLSNLTIPRYWETNSSVKRKERVPWLCLMEMAVMDNKKKDLDRSSWVSGGPGWSVQVFDCARHQGSYCIEVWKNGRREGNCFSTIPSPTRDVKIRLGVVLDVVQGRLAFVDVNSEKVLHKFDVTFHQLPYPVFGVMPLPSNYEINMQLVSGGEISMSNSKKRLIAEVLFSS